MGREGLKIDGTAKKRPIMAGLLANHGVAIVKIWPKIAGLYNKTVLITRQKYRVSWGKVMNDANKIFLYLKKHGEADTRLLKRVFHLTDNEIKNLIHHLTYISTIYERKVKGVKVYGLLNYNLRCKANGF